MVASKEGNPDFSDMKLQILSSLEDLNNSLCLELYNYWSGLQTGAALRPFDLIQVPKVIPFMVWLEHGDDEQAFRFKMSGQTIVEASGHDLTGEVLSIDDKSAPLTARICQMIQEQRSAVFSSDSLVAESRGRTWHFEEVVGLPLFGPSGNLVHIILAHGPQ